MSPSQLLRASSGHIRFRLFRDLVLLVLFTVGVLATVSWLLITGLKETVAESQITSFTALVRDEVKNLLVPVERQLLIVRDGLRNAGLTPTDRRPLDQLMVPVMEHLDQVAGTAYADSSGSEYFLVRDGDGWLTRIRAAGDAGGATWARWITLGNDTASREGALDYDPRLRPWFQAANPSATGAVWTGPYVFHSLKVPGMTAAVAWEDGDQKRALAMDVGLTRIVETVETMPLDHGGSGFLFRGDGGIFIPGGDEEAKDPHQGDRFFSAEASLGGPLHFDAVAAWRASGRTAEHLVRFHSGGRDWWGGFLPLSDAADTAWVGVVLPHSETFGIIQNRWHILASAALAIIAAGVGLVLLLMGKYSRQLRDLPKLSINRRDAERDLYDLIGSGEDAHLEFKSTMRTNLHTGKPGKEIEIAWLKGVSAFLNTEGGILLMGVADDGTVLGMEPDAFENEDRCRLHFKNLLNQHLGAEYARFVRFELYPLEGKTVGAVECERARSPAFLRHNNNESFLIRSGPSNIELSLSKALKYIRSRF
jgi:hypothetical protein